MYRCGDGPAETTRACGVVHTWDFCRCTDQGPGDKGGLVLVRGRACVLVFGFHFRGGEHAYVCGGG